MSVFMEVPDDTGSLPSGTQLEPVRGLLLHACQPDERDQVQDGYDTADLRREHSGEGGAVQVDPTQPMSKATGSQRECSKLKPYQTTFNFNLRCYTKGWTHFIRLPAVRYNGYLMDDILILRCDMTSISSTSPGTILATAAASTASPRENRIMDADTTAAAGIAAAQSWRCRVCSV